MVSYEINIEKVFKYLDGKEYKVFSQIFDRRSKGKCECLEDWAKIIESIWDEWYNDFPEYRECDLTVMARISIEIDELKQRLICMILGHRNKQYTGLCRLGHEYSSYWCDRCGQTLKITK
ncbi:MAG: hypothetical protein INQ03_03685 [Candidatus Heimdallarchaeota archaeon]|nr:hypothetical protein [Candidatus Heimdallarchaeota archaeon]